MYVCTYVRIYHTQECHRLLWMRDLFSQCTCVYGYVRTCLSRPGMSPIASNTLMRLRLAPINTGGREDVWMKYYDHTMFLPMRTTRMTSRTNRIMIHSWEGGREGGTMGRRREGGREEKKGTEGEREGGKENIQVPSHYTDIVHVWLNVTLMFFQHIFLLRRFELTSKSWAVSRRDSAQQSEHITIWPLTWMTLWGQYMLYTVAYSHPVEFQHRGLKHSLVKVHSRY